MTQSVELDKQGPDWPLGFIKVVTPGTVVGIMSLVDPNSVNAPQKPTPGTAGADEYTVQAQQIIFQGFTGASGTGVVNNTGNVYIMRAKVQGNGDRTDYGAMVKVLSPGETFFLASAPLNRNVFNPYRYFLDADNANDGAIVTLIIQ